MIRGLTLAVFVYLLACLAYVHYGSQAVQVVQGFERAVEFPANAPDLGRLGIRIIGGLAFLWVVLDLLIAIPRRRRRRLEEEKRRKQRPEFDPWKYRWGRGSMV